MKLRIPVDTRVGRRLVPVLALLWLPVAFAQEPTPESQQAPVTPATPAAPAPDAERDAARAETPDLDRLNRALEQWERQNRQLMESLRGAVPGAVLPHGDTGASSRFETSRIEDGVRRRFELSIAPDGKVTGKEVVERDGEVQEETFEAESFEALKRERPELAREFESFGDLSLPRVAPPADPFGGFGGLEGGDLFQRLFERLDEIAPPRNGESPQGAPRLLPPPESIQPVAPGRRLGVTVRAIPDDDPLRAHLDLPAGAGLLVDTVGAGSLAETLGLERHDILLRVHGREVSSPADVAAALQSAGDAALEVVVLRKGEEQTLKREPASG